MVKITKEESKIYQKVEVYFQKILSKQSNQIRVLKKALEFYANKDSFETQWVLDNPKWKGTGGEWTGDELILEDYGEKARAALKCLES